MHATPQSCRRVCAELRHNLVLILSQANPFGSGDMLSGQRHWPSMWVGWPAMGHGEEPRMDELKKLLRRLDGLDGNKSLAKKAQNAEGQQRGYVGALRGAPVAPQEGETSAASETAPNERRTSRSAVYVAALTAALISSLTVYMLLAWQEASPKRATGPHPVEPVMPSTFEPRPPAPGGSDARGGTTVPDRDFVRQAERTEGATGPNAAGDAETEPGGR